MAEWYVYDGAERGPFSDAEALSVVKSHANPSTVLLWRRGFDRWLTVEEVVAQARGGRPLPTPRVDSDFPSRPQSSAAQKSTNIVARHWRGELPLWVSYWVISFSSGIAVLVIGAVLGVLIASPKGYNPYYSLTYVLCVWALLFAASIWHLVGTWRSANHYADKRKLENKSAGWGLLAQLAVAAGFLNLAGQLVREAIPQISETATIALFDDPKIPPYSIRVMRNGTEAEIVGGFKYGLTDDFEKVLKASQQIKVIHLDSLGGRLGEGERLFHLIRQRGFNIYVSSKCMSACTLAYAGGKQRWLAPGAVLGFHKGAFPGVAEGDLDTEQLNVFRLAGFDPTFIASALSTPHREMWRPSADVLLDPGKRLSDAMRWR